jgi:predicted GNAT family N-acyltransferase
MSIIISEIARQHDRKSFDCGVTELNHYLQQQARQKTDKQISKTYVASHSTEPKKIISYHTLTGYSVKIPPAHKHYKNYPHPLSAVKLARLAVDDTQKGQGLGQRLLIDAIYRTVMVTQQIPTIGLFVDPMTPQIMPFYQQFGFLSANADDPSRLEMWLPIKTCIALVDTLM